MLRSSDGPNEWRWDVDTTSLTRQNGYRLHHHTVIKSSVSGDSNIIYWKIISWKISINSLIIDN